MFTESFLYKSESSDPFLRRISVVWLILKCFNKKGTSVAFLTSYDDTLQKHSFSMNMSCELLDMRVRYYYIQYLADS